MALLRATSGTLGAKLPVLLARSRAAFPLAVAKRPKSSAYPDQQQIDDLRMELAELRDDVRRLTELLEEDSVGYRRSSRRGLQSSETWKQSSMVGADTTSNLDLNLDLPDHAEIDGGANAEKGAKAEKWKGQAMVGPTPRSAKLQPRHVSEMGHTTLAHLALQGNHMAHRERLIREIMSTDNVSWREAHSVLSKMDEYKEQNYWSVTMPYRIGFSAALFGMISSALLVFYGPVAQWYGTKIAGEKLPDDTNDVSEMTVNQVGSWTWQWMEPMIGTASFVLLCAQFMRAQLVKLQMKTFLELVSSRKADRLADRFPLYDRSIVRQWAKPLPRANPNFFPIFERSTGVRGPSSGL